MRLITLAVVLTIALLAAAEAQQLGSLRYIGFLPAGASPAHRRQLEALDEGLRALGYVQGKNIAITLERADQLIE